MRTLICCICEEEKEYPKDKGGGYKGAPAKSCIDCKNEIVPCGCGCGKQIRRGIRFTKVVFAKGHSIMTEELREVYRQRLITWNKSDYMRQLNSESKRGDKNPNWNPLWSQDLYAPYQIEFYNAKQIVWRRDNRTCQVCQLVKDPGTKKSHVVHHIDEDPSNNKVENLVLLCRSCHRKVHAGNIELPSERN